MLAEKRLIFDYRELKGKIKARYGSQAAFGYAMGWTASQTSSKLQCKSYMTQPEIMKAARLLEITNIKFYFLTPKV